MNIRNKIKLAVLALVVAVACGAIAEVRPSAVMAAIEVDAHQQQQQPQQAGAPQTPPAPKNLQVLPKDASQQDVFKTMQQIQSALGVQCNFCHVNPFDQDTPRKAVARLMLRDYSMGMNHKNGGALSCNDCHKGQPNPLRTLPFTNSFGKKPGLQVLTGPAQDKLMQAMDGFNKALGVDCDYCHESDFEQDTPRKQIARFMMTEYARGLVKKDGSPLSCMDCHQGQARPLAALPFPRRPPPPRQGPTSEPAKKPGT